MNDAEIADLLRSDNPVVVIEAPAGCGKTHQAASYTAHAAEALKSGKVLVLTHTHAACSVIAERTKDHHANVDIRTLDSLINQVATAYRISLELPEDVAGWARKNGYETLAEKVKTLLRANPMICRHLAQLFPVIICDEHQDSNEGQDEIVRLLGQHGALLRIFGDPMQIIPGGRNQDAIIEATTNRWEHLKSQGVFGELSTPHRWHATNPDLGTWVLEARHALKEGNPIELGGDLPQGVTVIYAENNSPAPSRYILESEDWPVLNGCLDEDREMLLVAASNLTVKGLRGIFRSRFPIWEGHTRTHLEKYVEIVGNPDKDLASKTEAFVTCLMGLLVGFDNTYGNRFLSRVISPSTRPARGSIPPHLEAMAKFVREEPNHTGCAKAAQYLKGLIEQRVAGFNKIRIDYPRELADLIKLRAYDNPVLGFAQIAHKRSRAYPKPSKKALSTVHKSKGLEAESVVIFACDEAHFPNRPSKRNLLYVALSRATQAVTIVASRKNPTTILNA